MNDPLEAVQLEFFKNLESYTVKTHFDYAKAEYVFTLIDTSKSEQCKHVLGFSMNREAPIVSFAIASDMIEDMDRDEKNQLLHDLFDYYIGRD